MKNLRSWFLLTLFLMLAMPFLMAFRGLFQAEPPAWTDLAGVITWVAAGPGSMWILGKVTSYLAENFVFWQKLPSVAKFWIMIGAAILVPILAQLVLKYPSQIALVAPWFSIGISGLLFWLGSQQTYVSLKSSAYAANAKEKAADFPV